MTTTITTEGNLSRDPVLRFTATGKAVTNLDVAVNDRVKNDAGEYVDAGTTYYRVAVWNGLAENVAESVHKGDRVLLTGRLVRNEWTDNEGAKRVQMTVQADIVAVSLRFATAQVTEATRTGGVRTRKPARPDEEVIPLSTPGTGRHGAAGPRWIHPHQLPAPSRSSFPDLGGTTHECIRRLPPPPRRPAHLRPAPEPSRRPDELARTRPLRARRARADRTHRTGTGVGNPRRRAGPPARPGADLDIVDGAGAILASANVASVNYRYAEDALEPVYTHHPVVVDVVGVLKALDCYEYQSCEAPEWDYSEAYAICAALRREAIAQLAGYAEAEWDL